jgi:hypothetical protein
VKQEPRGKDIDMLKVWGRRSSFNVPHEHVDWGGRFGGLADPAFLAMNPAASAVGSLSPF